MLAFLLFLGVAAGIAWPFLMGKRGLLKRHEGVMETAPAGAPIGEDRLPARAREQLCPQCGVVNPPGRRLCVECSGEMPYDDMREGFASLWQGKDKEELIREGIQVGLLFVGMLIAVMVSNWLSTPGKLLVLLATFAILGFRFWRRIVE